MRTVSKVLLALCLLWNVGALAQQPTPFLPYPDLTPGGVFDVTLQDICTPGYSKKVRAVTKALRDQAYKSYGITSYQQGEYQLDHLIPLSIGGSNSISKSMAAVKQHITVERAHERCARTAIAQARLLRSGRS